VELGFGAKKPKNGPKRSRHAKKAASRRAARDRRFDGPGSAAAGSAVTVAIFAEAIA